MMDRPWHSFSSAPASVHFDTAALLWAGLKYGDLIRAASHSDAWDPLRPSWRQAEPGFLRFYGLPAEGHCLTVEPLLWMDLQEPQVTRGLAQFLKAGTRSTRLARTWALLHTLWRFRAAGRDEFPVPLDHVRSAHVVAEGPAAGGRRIDLVAWIETHDGARYGAVVEAKFAHHLTRGQLDAYERAATQPPYSVALDQTVFAVVASSFSKATARELRRHPMWCFVSWHRLLLHIESALTIGRCDDRAFAEFRRTVWHRASR